MAWHKVLAMAALALASVAPLSAEESPLRGRRAFQFDGAFAWAHGEGLPLLGVRYSRFPMRGVGWELGVATPPQALSSGLILMPDLDAVVALPMGSRAALLARGGVSGIVGIVDGGAGGIPGVNLGAGLLVKDSRNVGVRLDYTWRAFPGATFSSVTLGMVLFRR